MTRPPDHVASENDYRALRPDPSAGPAVSVVVPAYGRPDALARTLAGLLPQLRDTDEVVVVDDGSEPPITGLPDRVRLLRQERDGFGAARARNLGLAETERDVVLFLDADTIPGKGFVDAHRGWHAVAANLLVVSFRKHVAASGTTPEAIARNGPELLPEIDNPEAGIVSDWRRWLARRAARLTLGDHAFRAGLSNNMSIRRERLEEVGSFDEAFKSWGGEDTELTWRVWNSGAFIVPETVDVFHQVETDEMRGWRQQARKTNLALIADRVPHRFYRPRPNPFASVPKLSWIVPASTRDEVEAVWKRMTATPFGDAELIWVPTGEAAGSLTALERSSPRNRIAASVAAAILDARGEIIAFCDARVRFGPNVVPKAVDRLNADPRASVVRLPYALGEDRYRRLDDLEAVDVTYGRDGAPLLALAKRRELLKDRTALADPSRWWVETLRRSRHILLPGDAASAPLEALGRPRLPGRAELTTVAWDEAARIAVRNVRSRLRSEEAPDPAPEADEPRIPIDYVGFTERFNLGDDAVLVATQRLMPWARIGRDIDEAKCLMLGGGTLINGRRYYLTRILRRDTPTNERAVFGVGVRDPAFHGVTEPMEEWWRFFDSSLVTTVRGPMSVEHLRRLGYRGDVEVIGDPALSLEVSGVEVDADSVVVCPVWTSGNLMGGDDRPVFQALAGLIERLVAEGRHVTMLSAFPHDDRHIIELMRAAGHPDLEYVAGYTDVDEAMRVLARAGIVVAERLHAAILAAAASRPFVALEYWPKHRDFARSVDAEEQVVPTAGIEADSLWKTFMEIDRHRDEHAERVGQQVARLRSLQQRAAARLHELLEAATGGDGS